MGHVFILAYVVVVLTGVASIAISSFVYSRTRDSLLSHYMAYIASFSLFIFTYLCVLGYINLNVGDINFYILLSIVLVGLISSCLLMYALPRFTHSLVGDNPPPKRRLYFALAALCVFVLMLSTFRVNLAERQVTQVRNVWLYIAVFMFYAPVVYSIVLKGASLKRLEGEREKIVRTTMILDIVFFPGIVSDLYLFKRFQVFVFVPVLYCIVCVFFTRYIAKLYLVNRAAISSGVDEAKVQTVLETAKLSTREKDIVMLISKGLGNKEIAETLFISLNTVKTHNRNIFKKMDVKSRFQLMMKLREDGPTAPRPHGCN
jgi:DNA-binding CsgD family transcriptional regulator